MQVECNTYRSQIPKALVGELTLEEERALGSHISECPSCAREHRSYSEMLEKLNSATDVPVPRHFFVYSEQTRVSLWQLFNDLSFSWKAAVVAMTLAMGILCISTVLTVQVRADGGSYVVSFGRSANQLPLRGDAGEMAALKADLERIVEQKTLADKLEVVRTLREELDSTNVALSRQQRTLLATVLAGLEKRVDNRLATTAASLESETERSLRILYQAIELQHETDLAAINNRLDRIADDDEIKTNQTDTILETLLQVAELRMK